MVGIQEKNPLNNGHGHGVLNFVIVRGLYMSPAFIPGWTFALNLLAGVRLFVVQRAKRRWMVPHA
jgi:hypothetical protein